MTHHSTLSAYARINRVTLRRADKEHRASVELDLSFVLPDGALIHVPFSRAANRHVAVMARLLRDRLPGIVRGDVGEEPVHALVETSLEAAIPGPTGTPLYRSSVHTIKMITQGSRRLFAEFDDYGPDSLQSYLITVPA